MGKHRFLILVQVSLLYDQHRTDAVVHNDIPSVGHGHGQSTITPASLTADAETFERNKHADDEHDEPPSQPRPDEAARNAKAASLMASILDPSDTSVDRMFCPPINNTRYGYLAAAKSLPPPKHKQHFFALNLRQCVDLLPRLLGSLVEAIRFLGPAHCALSIVEGNSDDGTLETLQLLAGELQAMGVEYWLASSTLDPSAGLRIRNLAKLRAMALEPVTGPATIPRGRPAEIGTTYFARPAAIPRLPLTPDATITFINDVSACAEDILELIHQRFFQSPDMVCAMDWTNSNPSPNPNPNPQTPNSPLHQRPICYDIWITRSLRGNLLFDLAIPPRTPSQPHHPPTLFTLNQPTQVFSH
ncbi:glycosyltransferase family 69 protein [Parathielavia hyrcaniae]|uniref:Glycosyltransferase family 69 protein n=1 Tax=Parathielavia hyrcaniae TaxID=113614 RepID=A0AAN6T175_9PEZI|nr:glycosyltransferase family 69 protein [Parathielavia hyrcaniae]